MSIPDPPAGQRTPSRSKERLGSGRPSDGEQGGGPSGRPLASPGGAARDGPAALSMVFWARSGPE
eukprot:8925824-Pyramimonas_sp.AAC.1